MNFASPYVYDNVADDSYEVVSDEEFMEGMDLSDSGDSGDSEEELGEADSSTRGAHGAPAPAAAAETAEGTNATKESSGEPKSSPGEPKSSNGKPSVLNRVMGMLSSSVSRKSQSQNQSEPRPMCPVAGLPPKSKSSKAHHWKSSPHQRKSTNKGRMFRRADTNIVSLRFNTLKKPSTMHAGEVIQCAGCEAIMSNISSIEEDGPDKVWRCEFCGHRNLVDIEEEEKPAADDVTYLIEAALSTTTIGTSGRDESIVVFCIDISGSMTITTEVPGHQKLRGSATLRRLRRENTMDGPQRMPNEGRNITYISRLQAVQAAVDHQLGEMVKEFPHRRIALVTFSSDVSVIGDGMGEVVSVSGRKLMDKEELMKVGSELPMPKAIKEVRASLGEKIFGLEEGGSTALGPAMVIALSLASRQPGSKVILCTDGKSNEGVGKVENLAETDPSPEEFYESIAATANSKGVSVSVITISGTDCKLIQLGKLADSTRGQVNIVDPLKLTEEFSNVLADRIIATNVVAKFIVHKGLYIGQEENDVCKERREIGNVNSDQEISFEFGLRKRKAKEPAKPNPLDRISEVSTSLEERASSSVPAAGGGGDGKTNSPTETSAETGGGGDGKTDSPAETSAETGGGGDGKTDSPAETSAETSGGGDGKTDSPAETSAETGGGGDGKTDSPAETSAESGGGGDGKTDSPAETSAETGGGGDGKTNTATESTAEAAGISDTCTGGAGSGEEMSDASEDLPAELPFQVQITYTDVDGTKALRVLTQKKPLTKDRNVAERDLDLNVLALHTERRTSELALQGDYTGSRGVALMNQRLGWRSSHNSSDEMKRKMYRQVFTRVKTVENTVSHKQRQERLTYGRTHSDDEDEEEEMEDVKELMDSAAMAAPPPPPPPPAASNLPQAQDSEKPRSALKKMKMRSEEVDDSMANILYQARSASRAGIVKHKLEPSKK